MTYILEKNTHWQEKELNSESVVIPADWTSTALNTYADIISGQSPASDLVADLGLDFHQGNSLFGDKYIKPSTKKIDRTRAPKIAPAHSILFSVRAPVGEVNIACTEMCIGRGLAALTTEHVSEWMYFRLKSMSSVFKKLSTGTTFEGITAKNLGAVTFGCPPLNEQTAIANILSDQEALIAQYDNLIALHEKRFAYLSDELLSGRVRLVQKEVGEVELVKNHQWQNGSNEQVPQNWKHSLLGDIVKIERGTAMNRSKCTPGMVPVIAGGKKPAYYHNVANRKGPTITISASGSAGYVAYYEEDIFASDCSTISESKNYYLPYVYLFLLHQQDEIYRAKKGGAQPHVSPKDLNVLHFMEPPIEEQTLIANVLSDQKALIAQYKKLRDAEKKRFDWLSDALLSGTYRVKVEA